LIHAKKRTSANADRDRLTIATASADEVDLPPFDFLYAGYSLPFLERTALGRAWMRFRAQLRPDGLLAVNLFGPNDSWASRPDMSFVDRDALLGLVDGLDVLVLDEQERDGDAYSGPKHWHVFDMIRPTAERGWTVGWPEWRWNSDCARGTFVSLP